MKYHWYDTAWMCGDCDHKFIGDMRQKYHCPKCKSIYVIVDKERDDDITNAIATDPEQEA